MKKALKILLVFILVVIITMISIPLFFKGEIMKKVKEEINKSVYANVDWRDFSVSLIKGFPDLRISMKDLSVTGINNFEGDTLIAFDNFSAWLSLKSIFSGNINVKSILFDKPVVNAIVLADSSVNWDIFIPSEAQTLEEEQDTSALGINIRLKKFEIKNAVINYIDSLSDMSANLSGFNLNLKGNFSEDYTNLNVLGDIASLTYIMDGISYIRNATVNFNSLIEADLVNYNFTFSDNEIQLNDLKLGIEGSFGMPNENDITTDLKFFGKDNAFKSILSMIPAIYMQGFEELKAGGVFTIEGTVKGVYNEKELPKIDLALLVKDGFFSYPDLPKSANNISVDMRIFYDGVNEDNSKLDVNKFHIEMAGNPLDMHFHLITPMSDMQMNGSIKGKIDLESVADVVPVPDTKMSGIINADIDIMGKLSDIENENFEAFKADGLLEVLNMQVENIDIPVPVSVSKLTMNFTPRFVKLLTFDAVLGSSDVHMDGTLENFIPYVFKDETIRGKLNFVSKSLNINELMPETDSEDEDPEDSGALTVIEIPRNIDFALSTAIGELIYDKLVLDNLKGRVTMNESKLLMDNLSMNLLGGSMIMSGEYNTREIKAPKINFKLDLKEIDIPSSYAAFNTVARLTPIAELMKGKISTSMNINSVLDSSMMPVLQSMTGNGSLLTSGIEISNSETFNRISQALKNDNFRNVNIKNIKAFFEINNGRITLKPFDAMLGSSTVTIGGDQGLDQTMNYSMLLSIPRKDLGSMANDVYENLVSQAASKGFDLKKSDNVTINLKITGKFNDPKIGLEVKESLAGAKSEIKEAVQEKAREEVEKLKEDVSAKVNAEVEKIMKEAEEQAGKIKEAAKNAGDKLVGEAELQGRKLIEEAGSNPVKKAVAEKGAAELVKKARQKADALNKEAESKADAIMDEARKKADALNK